MNFVDVNNGADDGNLLSATDMAKDGDNIVRNYDLNSSKLLADVILFDYKPAAVKTVKELLR